MKKLILLVSVMSLVVLGTYASDKKEKEVVNAFEFVEAKALIFEARSLSTAKGGFKTLTSDYHLTIQGDSVSAYLPYMGRAYSAAYGGDGPIEFDNDMLEYEVVLKEARKEKNNRMVITFKAKNDNDIYECILSVWKSGNASLVVNSDNRQSISFDGAAEPIEDPK